MATKIINIVLTLFFLLFAIFQYNDEDAALWMAIYGIVALISAFAIFNKYYLYAIFASIILFLAGFIFYVPSIYHWIFLEDTQNIFLEMNKKFPYIEESREGLGLLLGIITLIYHFIKGKKINHPS